mgnify:CR=1 FL=1
MSFYQTLQHATAAEREHLFNAPIIEACRRGDISRETYLAFLAEAYYHVRHTVPLLMATGGKLGQEYEWVRGAIREYIDEEYGHQEWILNDIRACGGDAEAVRHGQPGQPIELMVAFLYDQIQRGNPMGFFGMVQVLEGENAVLKNRELMGATDPKKADAGTIRADFAESIDANAVHGSDSLENAAIEIAYFFSATEVCPR